MGNTLTEHYSKVQWICSSHDNRELAERYDRWATEYDADLDEGYGWTGPKRAVEYFKRHVPSRESMILDAGAGTGLVGALLAREGYRNLIAMDLSERMLGEARKKNAYLECHQMVMGNPLAYENAYFDAVVSVGVLTVGHAPPGSLDELVRITGHGGYILFSLRPEVYHEGGFKEKQDYLETEGKWKLVEVSPEYRALARGEEDLIYQIWIYRVT